MMSVNNLSKANLAYVSNSLTLFVLELSKNLWYRSVRVTKYVIKRDLTFLTGGKVCFL